MCQNAVAFSAQGDAALAVGLSNILRKSNDAHIGQTAARIIQFFGERGQDTTITLEDAWRPSIIGRLALILVAFAVPAVALGLATLRWNSAASPVIASPPAIDPLSDTFGPTAQRETPDTAPDQTAAPAAERTCDAYPSNGTVLIDHRVRSASGHTLEIDNGTRGDAIIKVRTAEGRILASFFVIEGQSAVLSGIPDGSYNIQYATGDKLAENCREFAKDDSASASQFPGVDTLETRYESDLTGTSIIHQKLTYTLYPVPGGTIRPNTINMDEFDKP